MTIQLPVDVALAAFDVLIGCAGLYEYVRRDSKVRGLLSLGHNGGSLERI